MFPVSDVIPPRTTPIVTILLIVANALTFSYELIIGRDALFDLTRALGVVPAHIGWPQLLTSLFVHDGWIHFGANMLYLWIFGATVEDSMSSTSYAGFYLAAGALAALAYSALNPSSAAPLVGASCAVAAVLGAYFVLFPNSQVLVAVGIIRFVEVLEVPAVFFLGAWFLVQLLSDLFTLGAQAATATMTFSAQLAGFGLGLPVGLMLRRRGRRWV